jgi:glycosyltransferase involved in cell wall biosynthesis
MRGSSTSGSATVRRIGALSASERRDLFHGVIRIARIITRLNIGGPSIQAIGLSRDLTGAGYQTCLMHGHLSEGEGDMTQLQPINAAQTVYIDALVRRISPLRDLQALWAIYTTLLRWKPHIIHTHQAKAGTLGRLAGIVYNWTPGQPGRARLIHTYHGHVFEGYFKPFSTRLFLTVERWLAKRTDVLIAISREIVTDLLSTYRIASAEKIRIVPLGFHLDALLALSVSDRTAARKKLAIADGAVVVTTVGRLTAIKQQTLFLDMAQRLLEKSSGFVFLIAGDGELRLDLERRAEDLGVEQQTRFLGWRSDLETVYAATDIFVLTSRNEGTPVALIEAMAAGLASASTDVGGVRDVITSSDVGTLVPFGDAGALAAAVAKLADDPGWRQELGRHARASVRKRFDAERLLGDIIRVYRHVLDPQASVR